MSQAQSNDQTGYDQVIIDIKDYVFYHQVPRSEAWVCARTAVLDALGCAMETLQASPECHSMLGPYSDGTFVPDGFRLPGTLYQLDPVKGAFDMGVLIRYLDHNDSFGGAEAGHPSDNLGAILAVSDWLCRASTSRIGLRNGPPLTVRTLLEATIKAYEIQGVFQIRNAFNAAGLDHTILVKLASTAVVSWLLGLSEDQTMAAISHVWMDNSPLRVYRARPNTIPRKGWAAGDACMRAVHLALLVRSGQCGAPSVLSAPRVGFYASLWGGRAFDLPRPYGSWVVENIFFKLIPAEGHGIAAIEAVLAQSKKLRARGLDPIDDIVLVKVRTQEATVRIISKSGQLHNAADRDHCIEYMLAVTLLKDAVPEVGDYRDESPWAGDLRVDALRAKINVVEDAGFTQDYLDPEKRAATSAVAIVLKDGSELNEIKIEYPLGHVENKRTQCSVRDKFRRNMRTMFEQGEIEEIIQAIEKDDLAISSFVDLFTSKGTRESKL